MTEDEKKVGSGLAILALLPLNVVSQCYVVPRIWAWHFEPFGLPAITWRAVIALWMLKAAAFNHVNRTPSETPIADLIAGLIAVWVAFGVAAWIRP